jgi:predicted transcriptional regulator
MASFSVRVDDELKEEMAELRINWSEFIREAIRQRVELERRKRMAEKLLVDLESGGPRAPRGFINETIRKMRENR